MRLCGGRGDYGSGSGYGSGGSSDGGGGDNGGGGNGTGGGGAAAAAPRAATVAVDTSEPPPEERARVEAVVRAADEPGYWELASRDGNREAHYRSPALGATLVHELACFDAAAAAEQRAVDARYSRQLPGALLWRLRGGGVMGERVGRGSWTRPGPCRRDTGMRCMRRHHTQHHHHQQQ